MNRARAWCLASALASIVAAAACGGNPSSPGAASLSLAGNWSGSFEYQTAGATVKDDATMVISQPAGTATGNWSTAGLTTGTVSFPASATVTGNFTITQASLASSTCAGSSTISGTASATDLVLTVANLTPTAACPWATAMKLTLKR